jgi:TolC family type I secretion outer membrane protein
MSDKRWKLGLGLAAGLGCILAVPAQAEEDFWRPDVFATQETAARSSGAGVAGAGDPCRAISDNGQPWSLLQVIDRALCHNPQTRQAWATARYQAAQVGMAQAAYLPTLSASGSASRGLNSAGSNLQNPVQAFQTGGGSGGLGSGLRREQTRLTPSLSFNYLLFDFGGREAKLDNARLALDAANWNHAAALQAVLFAAVQAYYQVFANQEAVASAETAEKSSAAAFEAAKVRHEIGAAALADQLQAQTAYAQARYNRQKAEGDARIAAGTLANALGLDADAKLSIASPALAEPDDSAERSVHELIEDAKRSRPDLAAAEAQIQAAEAGVRTAKARDLPSLSLVGNYAYSDSSLSGGMQSWSVGMQMSVPLFTGFSNTYQVRSAQEQVAVQEAARDKLDQSVALDVWSAYHNLNTARETFRSSKDLLASANQSEKVALGRYKAGAGNVLDLLSAQAALAAARVQLIQARYNWHIGKAKLAQALGRLDLAELEAGAAGGAPAGE